MPKLTSEHVARYALGAGFGVQDGTLATAIAMAESGGNTDAHAVNSKEDSRGLWQINVLAHPEYASQNLYDPGTNAAAAYTIFHAQGWTPWTTYTSFKYLAYYPGAAAGMATAQTLGPLGANAANDSVEGAGAAVSNAVDSGKAAVGFLQDLENPQIWMRTTKVMVGGLMILVGLRLLLEKATAPVVKKAAVVAAKVAK